MLILITYDVSTETSEGRRRLRQIAKVCLNYGQRVQKSVFECKVDQMGYESLERELVEIMNDKEDNLRLYRLHEPTDRYIKEYGKFRAVDFDDTLII